MGIDPSKEYLEEKKQGKKLNKFNHQEALKKEIWWKRKKKLRQKEMKRKYLNRNDKLQKEPSKENPLYVKVKNLKLSKM